MKKRLQGFLIAVGLIATVALAQTVPVGTDGDDYVFSAQHVADIAAAVSAYLDPKLDDLSALMPSGSIVAFGGASAPVGFMSCDGDAYDGADPDYADLFAALGTAHGNGSLDKAGAASSCSSGSCFNVPDLRGRFIRGQDEGTGRDPEAAARTVQAPGGATGDSVGSVQDSEAKAHKHSITSRYANGTVSSYYRFSVSNQGRNTQTTNQTVSHVATANSSGTESRPKNVSLGYIIKR